VHLDVSTEAVPVVIESDALKFVVSAASAIPAHEEGAIELLQDSVIKDRAHPVRARWGEIKVRGFTRSRYLPSLAQIYLPLPDTVDVMGIAADVVGQGSGKLAAACLLRARVERFGRHLNARVNWIKDAAKRDTAGEFSCYLETWASIAEQARKYGSSED
jgi:hypothetical protein